MPLTIQTSNYSCPFFDYLKVKVPLLYSNIHVVFLLWEEGERDLVVYSFL
jgi:hypothetical protein